MYSNINKIRAQIESIVRKARLKDRKRNCDTQLNSRKCSRNKNNHKRSQSMMELRTVDVIIKLDKRIILDEFHKIIGATPTLQKNTPQHHYSLTEQENILKTTFKSKISPKTLQKYAEIKNLINPPVVNVKPTVKMPLVEHIPTKNRRIIVLQNCKYLGLDTPNGPDIYNKN